MLTLDSWKNSQVSFHFINVPQPTLLLDLDVSGLYLSQSMQFI